MKSVDDGPTIGKPRRFGPGPKDMTGEVFGKLTVVAPAAQPTRQKKRTGAWWRCRCACGADVDRLGSELRAAKQRGAVQACPACRDRCTNPAGRASADLFGKVFGRLTVIARTEQPAHQKQRPGQWWTCRCSCGAETARPAGELLHRERSGVTQACGVCAVALHGRLLNDLTGRRFGRLAVIERVPPPRGRWWRCRCECGVEVHRTGDGLLRGMMSACRACITAAIPRGQRPETSAKRAGQDIAGKFTIYLITHSASQKRYVGLTRRSLTQRWNEHLFHGRAQHPRFHIHAALKKYGPAAFTREVLEETTTLGAAQEAEQWWIAHFGSDDRVIGYNGTSGGECFVMSDAAKEKLRIACTRQKANQTPEERRAIYAKGNDKRQATLAAKRAERERATLSR